MISRHAQLMNLIPAALVAALVAWLAGWQGCAMSRVMRTAAVTGTILALGFAQAGCGSSPYQLVKEVKAPAAPMELKNEAAGVEMAVTGLICYDSPGSWKKHAYWDEYLVQVTNHRTEPVTIESVVLVGMRDRMADPGRDPKMMEEGGLKNLRYLRNKNAPLNIPEKLSVGDLILGLATAPDPSGGFIATFGIMGVSAVAGPVWVANKIVVDPKQSKLVQAEIDRRRLVLPLTLAPGVTAQGSLFFPLTPGPQRMSFKARIGENLAELILDLKAVSGLHLTTTEKQPPPGP